jgi:hypothetical protein
VVVLHSCIVLSSPPLATTLPSGLNATVNRSWRWPVSGWPICFWVLVFHNRTVWSKLALARIVPSWLNATLLTSAV